MKNTVNKTSTTTSTPEPKKSLKKHKINSEKNPSETDPTPSATCATESSQKPNTQPQPASGAMEQKPQSSNGTSSQNPQPPLSDQQKAELAGLAHMLGIPQIAEQVTKLTEAVNSLMGNASKPISTAQAVTGGANFMQGLMPIIQSALPAVIGAFTGGGQQEANPVDKEIMTQLATDYRETLKATNEAAKLLINEIRAGKTIVRNPETGDLVITTRQTNTKSS